MDIKKKSALLFGSVGLITGMAGTVALQSHADTTSPAAAVAPASADVSGQPRGGHMEPGHDGTVTAISGNTITMEEKTPEGVTTSYTVDVANATFAKDGVTASLSDIKVGDKIFVDGTVSGTNVVATKVSEGRPEGKGGHMEPGHDGTVTAISGNTITMEEKTPEGVTTSYTVDVANATFTKDGAAGTIADIKVGDKIFVDGTVSGTNVTATKVFEGRPEGRDHRGRGPRPESASAASTASTSTTAE